MILLGKEVAELKDYQCKRIVLNGTGRPRSEIWGSVRTDPTVPAEPAHSAIQSDATQDSCKPKYPCLACRASLIKEQVFSEQWGHEIEAPQRSSTRSVCEAKWFIFTKCRQSNQVDFRAQPIKSIADFLLCLFQGRSLGSYSKVLLMDIEQP